MTADLAAWLVADDGPIAEDERWANAMPPFPWRVNPDDDEQVIAADEVEVADAFALSSHQTRETARWIATWDPARVLAECAAKRAIVERWQALEAELKDEVKRSGQSEEAIAGAAACVALGDAVRTLTQPYAGRADWRGARRDVTHVT